MHKQNPVIPHACCQTEGEGGRRRGREEGEGGGGGAAAAAVKDDFELPVLLPPHPRC